MMQITLTQMAVNVLNTKDGREKTALSRRYAQDWRDARAGGTTITVGTASPPGPTSLTCSARARFPSANPARWPVRLHCYTPWRILN